MPAGVLPYIQNRADFCYLQIFLSNVCQVGSTNRGKLALTGGETKFGQFTQIEKAEHEAHANCGKTCTRRLKWRESHKTLLGSWDSKSNKHGGIFNIKGRGCLPYLLWVWKSVSSTCTSMRTFPPFQAFHQLHSESSHGIISFQGIEPNTIRKEIFDKRVANRLSRY